jgi:hypothetical protein
MRPAQAESARASGVKNDDPRDMGSRKINRGRAGTASRPITLLDASLAAHVAVLLS